MQCNTRFFGNASHPPQDTIDEVQQQRRFARRRLPLALHFTLWLAPLLLLPALLWLATPVAAQGCSNTVTVTTTVDSGAGSLRQAIADVCAGGTINFAPGTSGQTIALSLTLSIPKAMTIDGLGAGNTILDGGNSVRVINATADLTLARLTVQNGRPASGNGGGIFASNALTLTNVDVLTNTASRGGGVYAGVTLAVTGTQFISNTASDSGGGAYILGAAVLGGGQFQNNLAIYGGGLYANSGLTLTDTHFFSNTASSSGGGAYVTGAAVLGSGLFQGNQSTNSYGGGIYAADTLALIDTQFISNSAYSFGGGVRASGVATVTNGLFQENYARSDGGGMLAGGGGTVAATQFFSNTAQRGGGLYAFAGMVIADSLFQANQTTYEGGGISTVSTLVLTDTDFLSNTAGSSGAGVSVSYTATVSGGLFANNVSSNSSSTCRGGGLSATRDATLAGAQFYSNSVVGSTSHSGGGAYIGWQATITGVHFVNNHSDGSGGGLFVPDFYVLTNTQFLSNTAGGRGGGMQTSGGGVIFGGLFRNNQAGAEGGAINASDVTTMQDTEFLSNTAATTGGAINVGNIDGNLLTLNNIYAAHNRAAAGGGLHSYQPFTVTGGVFEQNQSTGAGATQGGGAIFAWTTLLVSGAQFNANTAFNGGAIYQYEDGGQIVNSLFARNMASARGAAYYHYAGPGSEPIAILNSTIASPTVDAGSAIRIDGGAANITNTIVSSYTTGIERTGGTAVQDYNLFFGVTNPTSGTVTSGGNSLTGNDPAFVDPPTDDYLLGVDSAAVGAGTSEGCPATDLRGAPRAPASGVCDIGAYAASAVLRFNKAVTPTADAPFAGIITYTLVLKNRGPITDTAALFTDTLPVDVTFGRWIENAGAAADPAGNEITWQGVVSPSTVLTFTFSATNGAASGAVVTNTVVYSGDVQAGSATVAFNVAPVDTVTALTQSRQTTVYGQRAVFTATVTATPPEAGTPTGVVTFTVSGVPIATPLVGGTAVYSTTDLSPGSHPITATYGGATGFRPSVSELVTQTVNQAGTSTTLEPLQTVSFGAGVTFTATVAVTPPGSGDPTGIVTFTIDGAPVTATLSGGQATYRPASLSVGSHPVTVTYSGDANFLASDSPVYTQTVERAATSTTLDPSSPIVYGQSVTFTVQVTTTPATGGEPTGVVTFSVDGAPYTATLSAGAASYRADGLAAGSRLITAIYGGDANRQGSSSTTLTQTVNQATTSTALEVPADGVFGQSVTFTATVTVAPPGAGTPTGVVTFTTDTGPLGTATLTVGGVATVTSASLGAGSHPITATYGGDTNFVASIGVPVVYTVTQASTTLNVTAQPNPAQAQTAVTFTATVAVSAPGSGAPTGVVTFTAGAATFTATLSAEGVAVSQINTLPAGSHAVTAAYSGDASFLGASATSAPLVITCTPTYTVASTADSGAGSLRQAITDVCTGGTINFAPGTSGQTIVVSSTLFIPRAMTIDGLGAGNTIVDGGGSVQVIEASSLAPLTLANLTVQNGYANNNFGGGVRARAALTLTNLHVLSNTAGAAGGGVYAEGTLVVTGTRFISNTASSSGGGAFGKSVVVVQGSVFENNSGYGGGGLNGQTTVTLTDTLFLSNTAYLGGGVYAAGNAVLEGGRFQNNLSTGGGGGLYASSDLTLTGTQFYSNTANGDGGGVYVEGAAVLSNGLFQGNQATGSASGGGLRAENALTLSNTQFFANTAARLGGAVLHLTAGAGKITNVLLARNTATVYGAALYLGSPGNVAVVNATIVNPSVNAGSAIYVNAGTVHITNTIVASYTTGIQRAGGTVVQDYNLISGAINPTQGTMLSGGHSITSANPLFLAPHDDNYRLQACSPAIDAGNNASVTVATDLDGNPRIQGSSVDMGAYEVAPMPCLSMAKQVTPTTNVPYQGIVTYTVVLSNTGNLTDTATLTDALPVSVTFGSWVANPGAVQTGNGIAWSGAITPATALTFTFTAVNQASSSALVTNTAFFSGTTRAGSSAATYTATSCPAAVTVQNMNDSGAGSLRQAMADICAYGTITFDPSLSGQTILVTSTLSAGKAMTIRGLGAANTIVDGGDAVRVFNFTAATAPVILEQLTVQRGNATGDGGGINASGPVTLTNVAVLSSTSTYKGGGLNAAGQATLIATTFRSNLSVNLGGAAAVDSGQVESGLYQNNRCTSGTCYGGGLYSQNALTITGGQYISNTAAYGGGLYANGVLSLTNAAFLSNTVGNKGGGVYLKGAARIEGAMFRDNTTIGSGTSDGGGVFAAAPVTVTTSEFTGNTASSSGGGLSNQFGTPVTLIDAAFHNNRAVGDGGGVNVYGAGEVTVVGGLFQGNRCSGSNGGGLSSGGAVTVTGTQWISNTAARDGGGINVGGALTLTNATFLSNTASSNGGGAAVSGVAWLDGAIFRNNASIGSSTSRGGALHAGSQVTLLASEFTANQAQGGGGGAYFSGSSVVANISDSLFQQNSCTGAGCEGGGLRAQWTVVVTNTRFLSNTAIDRGGGMVARGATLVGGRFQNNHGLGGGALYLMDDPTTVVGTAFVNNTATEDGGAIVVSTGSNALLTLTNLTATGNRARAGGAIYAATAVTVTGGLYASNVSTGTAGYQGGGAVVAWTSLVVADAQFLNNQAVQGGALYHYGSAGDARIVNALFVGNTATTNGAAYFRYTGSGRSTLLHATVVSPTVGAQAAIYVGGGTATITNTIVASYTTGLAKGGTAQVSADYNLFFNAPTSLAIGSHSIDGIDPRFVDPAGGDYHLALGSPAPGRGINLGIATDLDSSVRSDPPTIGAYEGVPAPYLTGSKTVTPTTNVPYQGVVTYTVVLSNTGSLPDTVFVTDTLPAQVVFGGWVAQNEANEANGVITWSGDLAPAAVRTFSFTATHTAQTLNQVITNTATFSGALQTGSAGAAFAQVRLIYVDRDAAGPTHDGLSWTTAYTNVQDALSVVNADAATKYEIWVAQGIYYPDEGVGRINDVRTEYFRLVNDNVQLYGGFAATETLRTQRNWTAHPTILSGDIDQDGALTNNTYHVLYLDGVTDPNITAATVIDGFTITAGNAGTAPYYRDGGGLYCNGYGSGNGCSPTLVNVTFNRNQALLNGGAMYNDGANGGTSSPSLVNVTFSGNQASVGNGGAMFNDGDRGGTSSPSLVNVTFSGNQAYEYGGAMYNDGWNGTSSPSLVNVTFSGNQASFGSGGAMYNYGDSGTSSPSLVNVTFSGNQANYGGAMYNSGSVGTSSPRLVNVTFSGNWAYASGGAMYNYGWGGTSSPSLINVIMSGNRGGSRGGAQLFNEYATPSISYSLIPSTTVNITNTGASTITWGPGNITDASIDPLFVAPIAANKAPTTTGDYRLRACSPAIDAGNNLSVTVATDLDGNPRIVNGVVDMGAYESPLLPCLHVSKQVTPTTSVPDQGVVTYTLTLTNTGSLPDTVFVTDTLPAQAVFGGWVAAPAGVQQAGSAITWTGTITDLAPATTLVFTATHNGRVSETVTNTAFFSGSAQAGNAAAAYTAKEAVCRASGSGNWNDIVAACNAANPGAKIIIPAGVTVTLDQNITLTGDFEVEAGGSFNPNGLTVTLTGDQPQRLTGNPLTFYNLVVNKTSKSDTVTIVGKLKVTKKLTITRGKLVSASDYGDIEIEDQGELVLTSDITVGGHFTMTGNATFTPNTYAVIFDGAIEQSIAWEYYAAFWNLTVMTGTTLIEVNSANNVGIDNALTNYGVIRKTQPVSALESYSFGLAGAYTYGLEITVTNRSGANPLTAIQVDRSDRPHPNGPASGEPIYWTITGTGSDFVANVTLPHAGIATPLACRYSGGAWTCASSGSGADYVTFGGATAFSDWAVYDQQTTTTTLTSAPNASVYGQSVVFAATVTAAGDAPTGAVVFEINDTPVHTGTLASGVATYVTAGLTAGDHPVYAEYVGDANFTASASTVVTQTVLKATAAVTLTNLSQTYDGQPKQVTTSTVPAGIAVLVTYNGGYTLPVNVGSYTVVGTVDDLNYTGVATETLVIARAATTTTLTSAPNPSVYGQSVVFTATVTAAGGAVTPTGVVTFTIGANEYTATLTSGVATVTTSSLAVGEHVVAADYGGDASFVASSNTLTQTVARIGSTVMVVSAPNPSAYGQFATFTVTVAAGSATPLTPTGWVTLTINGEDYPHELTDSVTTYPFISLEPGVYTATATYAGDDTFAGSVSGEVTHTVAKSAVATTFQASPNPATYGQHVSVPVTVTALHEVAAADFGAQKRLPGPTGVVTLYDGIALIASGDLVDGLVTLDLLLPVGGVHTLTVQYGGDDRYVSDQATAALFVEEAATTSTLTGPPAPTLYGQEAVFTVTVAAAQQAQAFTVQGAGPASPTGQVQLVEGQSVLASGNLVDGSAQLSVPLLSSGVHTFTARYLGDGNYLTSTSAAVAHTVLPPPVWYTLTVSTAGTGNGSVIKAPDAISYTAGTVVTLTAQANAGATFAGWSGDLSGTASPVAITMDANKAVTATFDLLTYTIGVSANPTAGGAATGGGTYSHGASVVVTATANTGYTFVNWTEGGAQVSTNPVYSFAAAGNRTLVANFTQQPTPLAVNDAAGVLEGGAVDVAVLANDHDPAGGGLTVVNVTQPAHGATSVNQGAATVHYAAVPGYSGVDSFTYTLEDSNGQRSTATVAVVITALDETGEAPQVAPVDPTVQSMQHFTSSQATVTVVLPAGFFTGALEATDVFFLSYTPVVTPTEHTHTPPGTLRFGNFQFELTAFVNDQPQHGLVFAQPVTLTIVYNPALMVGLNLETLELYAWDGAGWSTGGIVILHHDIANATLTIVISHLSEFAFFAAGVPTNLDPDGEPKMLYLPAVMSVATESTRLEGEALVEEAEAPGTMPEGVWLNELYLPVITQ